MSSENIILPPSTKKITSKQLSILLAALLVVSIATHAYSYYFFQNQLKRSKNIQQSKLAAADQILKTTENKLSYCFQDRASNGPTIESQYSFETFGVYSPLLDGATVHTTTFYYKDTEIESKYASFTYEESTASISVWSVKRGSYFDNDFPIFVGYENHGTPTFLSDLKESWKDIETYNNKAGDEYHFEYYTAPRQIYSVGLDHFSTFSSLGRAMLVSVSYNVKGDMPLESTAASVIEAKSHAKSIADTIKIKL